MAKVIRKSIPNWFWLLVIVGLALVSLGWFSLNRPLPEYLVAKAQVGAGNALDLQQFESIALDLGPVAGQYLKANEFDDSLQVADTIAKGELVPKSRLTSDLPTGQTAIRITPALQVAEGVVPGGWVSVWRVVKQDDIFTTELLIPRSKVISIIEEEGLFANSVPQVELLIDINSSSLLMQSITAENDIYLLPLP